MLGEGGCMRETKIVEVLGGSELDGADQDIADWAGLSVPEDKWDEYVDLIGGTKPLSVFFDDIRNGTFEKTEEEEDMGPGMNDTYWVVTTSDVEALRVEVRNLLMQRLEIGGNARKHGRGRKAKRDRSDRA